MKHKTTLVDHLRSSAGVGRWTTAMHEAAWRYAAVQVAAKIGGMK